MIKTFKSKIFIAGIWILIVYIISSLVSYHYTSSVIEIDIMALLSLMLIVVLISVFLYLIIKNNNKLIKSEEKERNLSRMYATLSGSNHFLIRAEDESVAFNNICRIIVEKSGFIMAWVGIIDKKSGKVKPVSSYGYNDGYLDNIEVSIDPLSNDAKGPTGMAISEGKIIINNDTSANTDMKPWRAEALKRGFNSSASIPIEKHNEIIGALNIYSDKAGSFDEKEVKLLGELKEDLSFMLSKIDNEKWMNILYLAMENSKEWMLITDDSHKIIYANRGVEKISKWKREELIGKTPNIFESGLHKKSFYSDMSKKLEAGEIFEDFFINRDKNGELFYLNVSIIPVYKTSNRSMMGLNDNFKDYMKQPYKLNEDKESLAPRKIFNYVAIAKDITETIALEEKFKMLSLYDPLTQLPNKQLFLENINNYIRRAASEKKYAALIVIDLYRFSYFNSAYGYETGDNIIKAYANFLSGVLRGGDIVARFGPDDFGVFLENINGKDDIFRILEKLKVSMPMPLIDLNEKTPGHSLNISFNSGIALFPDDGETAADLVKAAYIALADSKTKGENELVFYKTEMNLKAAESLSIKDDLMEAFKNKEFIVYYQPYFDASTGKPAGIEALTRWNSGQSGLLLPAKFIHNLEEIGLIRQLEEYLADNVCRVISQNEHSGFNNIPISINISPVSFKKEGLFEMITSAIEKYKIAPSLFNIEITESLFLENFDYAIKILNMFKEIGIKIFIDDFGTGYSSLSYIKNIPADVIKIDISFIKGMMYSQKDFIIVNTIIELARKLGLRTICEGVETEEQLEKLKSIGADLVQGFLYSRPVPESEIDKFLKR